MVKMAVYGSSKWPKSISHKIREAEKFLNFHTVQWAHSENYWPFSEISFQPFSKRKCQCHDFHFYYIFFFSFFISDYMWLWWKNSSWQHLSRLRKRYGSRYFWMSSAFLSKKASARKNGLDQESINEGHQRPYPEVLFWVDW